MEVYYNNPFNYLGGKYKLISQILPLLPNNISTYIELFSGGYTLGLNVNANKYIYNDKCYQLANLVKVIKETDPLDIIKEVDNNILKYNLPTTSKGCTSENESGYLTLRSDYNIISEECMQKSILFYTLICHSFNNMLGFNGSGDFNIPIGRNRSTFNSSLRSKLVSFSNRIKEIDLQIYSKDFKDYIDLDKDTFVYADPPYLISDDAYSRNPETRWSEEKEKELLDYLDYLNDKGIKFGLSNITEHKGKINTLLVEWSKKYYIAYLDKDYNNCNYQCKDEDKESITTEVYITNHPIGLVDNRIKNSLTLTSNKIEEKDEEMLTAEKEKTRVISEETKRKISEAQKKRWAQNKGEPAPFIEQESIVKEVPKHEELHTTTYKVYSNEYKEIYTSSNLDEARGYAKAYNDFNRSFDGTARLIEEVVTTTIKELEI